MLFHVCGNTVYNFDRILFTVSCGCVDWPETLEGAWHLKTTLYHNKSCLAIQPWFPKASFNIGYDMRTYIKITIVKILYIVIFCARHKNYLKYLLSQSRHNNTTNSYIFWICDALQIISFCFRPKAFMIRMNLHPKC